MTATVTKLKTSVATAPPKRTRPSIKSYVIAAVLIALLVVALHQTEFSLSELASGYHGMASFISGAFPPDFNWSQTIDPGLHGLLVTFSIGFAGTVFALPFSFILAILGSRVTCFGPTSYQVSRTIMSILRSIPSIVFALIFITAVGLGPYPGVLALIFHSSGITAKLWAEAMDEVDMGPVEALRTAGASRRQVLQYAILPSVAPTFVGLILYRLDVNVREALVLGLIGAGGIGFLINQSIQLFKFDQMLTQIILLLALIIAVDQASSFIRKRLAS